MLPMWVLALPIWLVVLIVLYALATLYVAIKYPEVRKFLAEAKNFELRPFWHNSDLRRVRLRPTGMRLGRMRPDRARHRSATRRSLQGDVQRSLLLESSH
jgi:hypothetical protein